MSAAVETARGRLPESWHVEVPVFEGPLDLLLELIKVNEIDLLDIPIALICDQFHEYLALMEELDLDIAGEYIYEAALLIQLKARMLLPVHTEEGAGEDDPRVVLVERLLEYQRLKEAALTLSENESLRRGMRARPPQDISAFVEEDDDGTLDLEEVSLYDLLVVFRQALDRYDREHPPALVYRGESYSIRDQFERFLEIVEPGRPFDLLEDLLALSCRSEAVAAFLALLELCRLQLIRLHQTGEGDVLLYRTTQKLAPADLLAIQG